MYPGTLRPKSEGPGQGHIAQTQCFLGLVRGRHSRAVFLRLKPVCQFSPFLPSDSFNYPS